MSRVGIILSGCGFYDGTEVAEAVLAALAVERAGARPIWLSPEVTQMHVVDHLTGSEAEGERREVLAESARIARGKVKSLAERLGGGGHRNASGVSMNEPLEVGVRRVVEGMKEVLGA